MIKQLLMKSIFPLIFKIVAQIIYQKPKLHFLFVTYKQNYR
jgi:hypothetical protein